MWHAGSVCSVSTGVSSGDSVLDVCANGMGVCALIAIEGIKVVKF